MVKIIYIFHFNLIQTKLKKKTFKFDFIIIIAFIIFLAKNTRMFFRIQEQSTPEQEHNQTQNNAKFHTKSLSPTETSKT